MSLVTTVARIWVPASINVVQMGNFPQPNLDKEWTKNVHAEFYSFRRQWDRAMAPMLARDLPANTLSECPQNPIKSKSCVNN
jgi:hypothetical protein